MGIVVRIGAAVGVALAVAACDRGTTIVEPPPYCTSLSGHVTSAGGPIGAATLDIVVKFSGPSANPLVTTYRATAGADGIYSQNMVLGPGFRDSVRLVVTATPPAGTGLTARQDSVTGLMSLAPLCRMSILDFTLTS